jgi:UDP-N-acetyl-D-glucosamine dehydrogenase
MGINIWEVIDAAKTKPFGFMPFYPGPGMGGHCIPIDPFYLSWKAKEYHTEAKFIELAGEINRKMTEHVAHRIGRALNDDKKSIRGSKILIVGVAYKKDIEDIRESPALRIMNMLKYKGAKINYHDPYVENVGSLKSLDLTKNTIEEQDAILITTDHTSIDYSSLGKYAKLIVDTRNIMATVKNPKARVIRA